MSFFTELVKLTPQVRYFGVGGDLLSQQGMELFYHLKDFSSMGFSEVVGKIPFYFKALKKIESEVLKRETKVAILIDFQDFNLRLAQKLASHGVKVLYYVAPQAWAWKAYRAQILAKTVHTLFTILPFEKDWFLERGVGQVKGIPHPLMLTYSKSLTKIPEKPFGSWKNRIKLLLLPGSRKSEVYSLMPIFIETVLKLRQAFSVEVHLVKVAHIDPSVYAYFSSSIDVWYDSEQLQEAMSVCHMALAASGTVTLSTGLFELPTVVCYKASLINEFIFYQFIKYKGPISLTNIIHNQMVFPEFVQDGVNANQLCRTLTHWLTQETTYNNLKAKLKQTKFLMAGENFSVPEFMANVINERN